MEQKNIIAALVKSQLEITAPKKSGLNGAFARGNSPGSAYATLDDILNAVRDSLAKNGIAITCSVERNEFGFYAFARLLHTSGEMIESKFPMLLEKQTNQGIASARTYAFRYVLCNLLALPSDEDDDGNASSLTEQQQKELKSLIGDDDALENRVLKGYERKYKKPVKTFADIRQEDFAPAISALKATSRPHARAV